MLSNKQLNFSFQEKQDFIPCVLIGKSGLGQCSHTVHVVQCITRVTDK